MIPCERDTPLIRSIVDAGDEMAKILTGLKDPHDPVCRRGSPSILIGCPACEAGRALGKGDHANNRN